MKNKKIILGLILSALIILSLVGMIYSHQTKMDNQTKEDILLVKERVAPDLMAIPGVVGVGIQKGQIAVYVKEATDEILSAIPLTIEGYSVIVIESGEFVVTQTY